MEKLDKILNFLKNYEFISQGHKIDFKDAIQIHNNIVDISCSIFISNNNIISLTNGLFKFGKINGTFDCSNCYNLKSLEGSPKVVGRDFYCNGCENLKSLKGGP